MKQRGRKSAASLSVVPIDAIQRPKPPESMSEAGKKLWRDTVNALRADWFQGAEPVLEVYVETIELSRWLWEMITVADREGDEFAELVKLHCQVSALIGNLATKLRLTPQSSRDARIPKLVPVGPKPWEWALGGGLTKTTSRDASTRSPTSRKDHQPHRSVRLPQWTALRFETVSWCRDLCERKGKVHLIQRPGPRIGPGSSYRYR